MSSKSCKISHGRGHLQELSRTPSVTSQPTPPFAAEGCGPSYRVRDEGIPNEVSAGALSRARPAGYDGDGEQLGRVQ